MTQSRNPTDMKRLGTLLKKAAYLVAGVGLFALAFGIRIPWLQFDSAERHIYFKLPLEQPRFHWRFLDAQEFLSGSLTVRVIGEDRTTELLVFENGSISDGWRSIGRERDGGEIYFGFFSEEMVKTASRDSIEIELFVPEDLEGIGPRHTGILPAGRYTANGSYSILTGKRWHDRLTGDDDEPTAFLGCWQVKWPLQITSDAGWLSPEIADRPDDLPFILRVYSKLFPERGTNGARCVG